MITIKSIRNRVLLWVFLLFLIIWAGISYAIYLESSHEVEELFDSELAQAAGVLLQISSNLNPDVTDLNPTLYKEMYGHRYEKKIAFQIYHDGELILRSANAPADIMANKGGFSNQLVKKSVWRVFRFDDNEHKKSIVTAESNEVRQELINEITQDSLYPLTLMIPILLLMIWIGIDLGLQPIRKLARQIAKRSPDNLEPFNANFNVPNEILPLFTELNDLLTKLKNAFERERRFTSDAAHELQTPLASIKTQAQVAMRAKTREEQEHALHKAVEGIDRATHMVQQLLSLARLEPIDESIEMSRLDLCQLTQYLIGEVDLEAHGKSIELSLNECGPVFIRGNKAAIEILIRNLLSNAVRYTPENGQISVSIEKTDSSIRLSVTDTGPGIPDTDRERVFERFYRGQDKQHIIGSGLGLSIAKRIADLHHAQVSLEPAESDKGLKVTVEFEGD